MNLEERVIRLFDKFPFLYSLYEKMGLKDIRNGTNHLRKRSNAEEILCSSRISK